MRLPCFNDVHPKPLEHCRPNQLVNIYLMTSYLYYHLDESVITDTEFDYVCTELYRQFDDIKHQHKHLIDKNQLIAGTGYYIAHNEFPNIVIGGAKMWLRESLSRQGRWETRKVKKSQKEYVRKKIIANTVEEINGCMSNMGLWDASVNSIDQVNPRTVVATVDCLE